jgi:hypothetical protein
MSKAESWLSVMGIRELTQARRVKLCKPSCWVISAGLMAFYQKKKKRKEVSPENKT